MPFDAASAPLCDSFGRPVTYLRLSVTDRCDLRCTYCMPERMKFLPRRDVLSLEDMARLAEVFIRHGVRKIRLTGGEPLVRKDVMVLVEALGRHVKSGRLDELCVTTNGTLLERYAADLIRFGVKRVNVSLDTLNAERYREVTRLGDLDRVIRGIREAQAVGLSVKLNAVASRGVFEGELDELIRFAHFRGVDLTLIEQMPMGDTGNGDSFLSLASLRDDLAQRWTLQDIALTTEGPARYVTVRETGGRLGFITPMSCSFCDTCNRVRLSCTGKLYTCMGNQGATGGAEGRRETKQHDPISRCKE
ncbi:GTP 3',8-cyclase MoaA [Aliiroseovarius subalbicans]|uniref:GTP 3',8-cyclase MoaA n=1 Tax=Aliiroseovarius subalbicans TaxID=2925840 RepID=UPI001F59EEF2|nr:GTP 3',8-cyclase MoaA [Aliiroseovarius subalbicans]MCI2400834.1 GTP 3',8-cyclase MoaA [Aliiroseovarius subalbicans]